MSGFICEASRYIVYGKYPSIRFRLGGVTKVVAHETHTGETELTLAEQTGFESKTEEMV